MTEERISIIDLAKELGIRHKQTVFKVVKKLRIQPAKHRDSVHGQLIYTITLADADTVRSYFANRRNSGGTNAEGSPSIRTANGTGVFYLIQLEPVGDPGRFKVGFATDLKERLRKHRCSAPLAKTVKSWPCRENWERTAIDCVTNGCEKLHIEVFRTTSLAEIVRRADAFFQVMPKAARGS